MDRVIIENEIKIRLTINKKIFQMARRKVVLKDQKEN